MCGEDGGLGGMTGRVCVLCVAVVCKCVSIELVTRGVGGRREITRFASVVTHPQAHGRFEVGRLRVIEEDCRTIVLVLSSQYNIIVHG